MNDKIVLDDYDVKFIHVTKSEGMTLKALCNVWAERCGIRVDHPEIPKHMVNHFFPLLLQVNADRVTHVIHEVTTNADPNGFRYTMFKHHERMGYPGYWEALLLEIAGQFSITEGKRLPGYVRKLRYMGYNVPAEWVEY